MSFRVASGSNDQARYKREMRSDGGVSGTTWKKKSRQGLVVVRKVGEKFSVSPRGGCGGGEERWRVEVWELSESTATLTVGEED